ncbi:10 TM domain-containing transmembrane protein [Acrasis kona]|uniref:10 TM domain-containing transmembrane protein n=1 Tax=Acrasis kona TaxID=1008807 RepID=A0AAW2YLZ5_9EUKA
MIVFIPGSPIGSFVLDKFGMRVGVGFGAVLNTLGVWVRVLGCLTDGLFSLVFLGQTLCAVAQCFLLSTPPKLASSWFSDNEQSKSVAIGSLFNWLGVAIGFFLSSLIVKQNPDMIKLLIIHSIICTVTGLLAVVCFRNRPPTPPSSSANDAAIEEEKIASAPSVKHTWKTRLLSLGVYLKPLQSKSFILLVFGFGSSQGMFYAISTVLDQLLKEHPYQNEVGYIGVVMTLAGIVGAMLFSVLADATGRYVLVLKLSFIGLIISFLLFTLILQFDALLSIKPLIYIGGAILGIMATSNLTLSLDVGVGAVHPVPEATSAAYLLNSAQAFGILFIIMIGELVKRSRVLSLWLGFGITAVFSCLVMFFNAKINRSG